MFSVYDGYKEAGIVGKTFFAGANTGRGFESSYRDILNEGMTERVYIIKGGPGCGKSTVMHRIADAVEAEGYSVEYFLCGSDPESLDCIVTDGRIAVLDGTPPHSHEMKYPGASSELVDLSRFWDNGVLEAEKEKIIYHSAAKSMNYASAYRFIKSAEILEEERQRRAADYFDYEKAGKNIDRLIKSHELKSSDTPIIRKRYSHSISMRGKYLIRNKTEPENLISVKDSHGTAPLYMELLHDKLTKKGISHDIRIMPLSDIITGIFVPDGGLTVAVDSDIGNAHVINSARFEKHTELVNCRGEMKLCGKIEEECLFEASVMLKKAADSHFALEEIYKSAMDFDSMKKYSYTVVDDIITRLKKGR